jgi:hypothetical protein
MNSQHVAIVQPDFKEKQIKYHGKNDQIVRLANMSHDCFGFNHKTRGFYEEKRDKKIGPKNSIPSNMRRGS